MLLGLDDAVKEDSYALIRHEKGLKVDVQQGLQGLKRKDMWSIVIVYHNGGVRKEVRVVLASIGRDPLLLQELLSTGQNSELMQWLLAHVSPDHPLHRCEGPLCRAQIPQLRFTESAGASGNSNQSVAGTVEKLLDRRYGGEERENNTAEAFQFPQFISRLISLVQQPENMFPFSRPLFGNTRNGSYFPDRIWNVIKPF